MTKARDLADGASALSAVSATELGYLDGVTSAVQTQINSKQAVVSGVNDTEIGYLDGVTSAVQTQLDAKIPKTLTTTTGDIIYASSANTPARLGIGSTAQVLTVSGGVPAWATPSGGSSGPAFQAYSTPTQSVSSSVNTKATMTNEKFDTAGNFTSSRFTPTTAGYYQLRGAISYSAGPDKTSRAIIYFNGSPYVGSASMSIGPSIANPTIEVVNLIYFNGSTDYAELYGWSDSASPEFYYSSFEGVWIRA